ncbi:MAG: NAD(P)/FAD-dependent oxidoreductase [Firmicutes bacterium]|nr:NAD(P)/FAD-dependent oxidoreductase [Bacillota bacterium]
MVNADAIVVGGGAAGMMAAGHAARLGAKVLLLEKTDLLGKKLLITGKGRCNITNSRPVSDLLECYPGGAKFLRGPLHRFSNTDVIHFFEDLGVPTKVERGGRVFPCSDRADTVVSALRRFVLTSGAQVQLNAKVVEVLTRAAPAEKPRVYGVKLADGRQLTTNNVVITTGGKSYPGTGSSGDGYELAARLGHCIEELFPALVPLRIQEQWARDLQGLSLRNVTATLLVNGKVVSREFGEMLFTSFGVSGPIILTLSRAAAIALRQGAEVKLRLNLKPALDEKQLDNRLQRDFQKYSRKQLHNGLVDLLPKALIDPVIAEAGIEPNQPVNQITKEQRTRLVDTLTGLEMTVTDTLGLAAAIVTAGGVSLKEVSPQTMESKLVQGLFFAGEVLDIDGVTGGYNLQAAFSTGRVAAESLRY